MKGLFSAMVLFVFSGLAAQQNLTPEKMWQLGRVAPAGMSKDGSKVAYTVTTWSAEENKSSTTNFVIPVKGGNAELVNSIEEVTGNSKISPDGKWMISSKEVKVEKVFGSDYYPDLSKSNVQIYDQLNYRHWDTWEDGKFGHVFLSSVQDGKPGEEKDLMAGEPFDCPTKPDGDETDYTWSPDSKQVVYVTKKKSGTAYAISTNSDVYSYDVASGITSNLSEANKGYDVHPQFNREGKLAWMQMKRDGNEADKQDLVVLEGTSMVNLTGYRDDLHVEGFKWSNTDNRIFFWAPVNGTMQLFEVMYNGISKLVAPIRQITKGDFDITGIAGQYGNMLVVSRTDFNHAAELFTVDLATGNMAQLTHVNDDAYAGINLVKSERRFVKTADNKQMLVWLIYPPHFDASKNIPLFYIARVALKPLLLNFILSGGTSS
jgi:dipeptidyl aminopeptidase/acylaminoacyl peptidase